MPLIYVFPCRRLGGVIACLLGTLAISLASANTIEQTDSFSINTTVGVNPVTGQALAGSFQNLTFNDFNSSLGTLTGVTVSLTGNAAAVLSFLTYSTTASATFTNGMSTTSFQISELGGSPSPLVLASSGILSASMSSGTINGAPAAGEFGYTSFTGSSSPVSLTGSVTTGNLASFIGSGSAALFRAAFGTATDSGNFPGGNYFVDGGGIASGNVMVTYTYAPVPLPAGILLLISGIGGLGALVRRREAA